MLQDLGLVLVTVISDAQQQAVLAKMEGAGIDDDTPVWLGHNVSESEGGMALPWEADGETWADNATMR